jgi:hypothetical protein
MLTMLPRSPFSLVLLLGAVILKHLSSLVGFSGLFFGVLTTRHRQGHAEGEVEPCGLVYAFLPVPLCGLGLYLFSP